jgi:sporulation protein YlmC with PRC-barrel domain
LIVILRRSDVVGKLLIESDRVEGTYVYDHDENHIGTIKRLMIEKVSGHVVSAVISFGGFFGLGESEYAIPWNRLHYDLNLSGYRTDVTEDDLKTGKYR